MSRILGLVIILTSLEFARALGSENCAATLIQHASIRIGTDAFELAIAPGEAGGWEQVLAPVRDARQAINLFVAIYDRFAVARWRHNTGGTYFEPGEIHIRSNDPRHTGVVSYPIDQWQISNWNMSEMPQSFTSPGLEGIVASKERFGKLGEAYWLGPDVLILSIKTTGRSGGESALAEALERLNP